MEAESTSTRSRLGGYLFVVAYFLTIRAIDDIQVSGWEHSDTRRYLLELRDRIGLTDLAEQLRFRTAVRRTIANLEESDHIYDWEREEETL